VLANAISHQFRQVRTVRTIVRPHSTEYFFQVSSLTRLKNLNSQAKVFSIKTGFSEIFKRERKKMQSAKVSKLFPACFIEQYDLSDESQQIMLKKTSDISQPRARLFI
jgi:hypothetical protein